MLYVCIMMCLYVEKRTTLGIVLHEVSSTLLLGDKVSSGLQFTEYATLAGQRGPVHFPRLRIKSMNQVLVLTQQALHGQSALFPQVIFKPNLDLGNQK